LLEATLSSAPPELFPPDAVEALRQDRGTRLELPAVGLECRLAAGRHPVDLGLVARPSPGLPPCVDAVFFEWDQVPPRGLRASPLCFYRFGIGISVAEAMRVVAELVPARDLGALAALPPDARVTDIGLLDARVPGWFRLGLLVGLDTARELLAASGWHESEALARLVLDSFAAELQRVRVQVDLHPLRLAGIELVADQSPRGDGWATFLELLTTRGLCDPPRARAVQRWPAIAPTRIAGLGWCGLHRTISHLKLSRATDGSLQAKAYLFARLAALW
jgi:hypothetical protein